MSATHPHYLITQHLRSSIRRHSRPSSSIDDVREHRFLEDHSSEHVPRPSEVDFTSKAVAGGGADVAGVEYVPGRVTGIVTAAGGNGTAPRAGDCACVTGTDKHLRQNVRRGRNLHDSNQAAALPKTKSSAPMGFISIWGGHILPEPCS